MAGIPRRMRVPNYIANNDEKKMPKPSTRPQKIADLIQQELALLIRKTVHDPRLTNISLTAVELTPDLKLAKVFYTVFNPEDRKGVAKAFEKAAGFLRHALSKSTELRYIPQLRFIYDESIERGERMSSLIGKALESDKKLHEHDDEEPHED